MDATSYSSYRHGFRNTTEALDFYALMERLRDINVVFCVGHFERSPVGEFSYTTLAAAHTMERKMTGAKIKSAYTYLNAQGAPTGQPPYGYARGDGGGFVVIEEEAKVVRRIFEMYAAGTWSAQAIAARLNDEGVVRHRARSRHGWLPDSVVDILRNVAYVGKTYSESRARRLGELIDAQWPAIVCESEFERAQELLGERRVRRALGERAYAFGRLLCCVGCGEIMRATTTQGNSYYHCRRDVADRCASRPLRDDVLVLWAAALFDRLEAVQPEAVKAAVLDERERRQTRTASVEQVNASLERMEKLFVWGHVTEDDYLARRRHLEGLRAELLTPTTGSAIPVPITGIGQAWRQADAARRRLLLAVFFEKLYTDDGVITKYVPHREYAREVEAVITLAVGDGLEFDAPGVGRGGNLKREHRADGPTVVRGKGGVLLRVSQKLEAAAG